jgi:hypothetical protein
MKPLRNDTDGSVDDEAYTSTKDDPLREDEMPDPSAERGSNETSSLSL